MNSANQQSQPGLANESVTFGIKAAVIIIGATCSAIALFELGEDLLDIGYLAMLAFSILIAPRMTLTLPRSRFAISFSDALIFLAFLLYGGWAAIFLAAVEMLANCIYLRSRGFDFGSWMIPTNVSINAIYTTLTFGVWLIIPPFLYPNGIDLRSTPHLIGVLGVLTFSQFFFSTVLAALFQSLTQRVKFIEVWKKDCFSSSMTQMVGAALAGIVFKMLNYGDLVTAGVTFIALMIAFLNYRQSIGEINNAIASVETAERQKADTERERREEAENYAFELTKSLEKEALTNEALRKSRKDLEYSALHDSLTGLANRKKFGDKLKDLIELYKSDESKVFQVLYLDIKGFKDINDTLGHTIGDKVLSIAARRFVRMVNQDDVVARLGGDEFAIILRDVSTPGKAQKVARRIYQSIRQPFALSGNTISIDVNIGIAPSDAEYNTPEEVLRDADIAMHFAKERNEGPAFFTKEMRFKFLERVRFENDLRHAIDRKELSLHYQPIVALEDGNLMGFEALLRWQHNEIGMVPPNRFIPIAEQSGLIQSITVWILKETTKQLAQWQKLAPEYQDLFVSVNISGKHLSNEDLFYDVEEALEYSGLAPHSLKLEITESSAMENAEHTITVLNELKRMGIQLSIDDFGTGYSSLSYLHRLPFDTLKVDRSFVYRVGEHGENSGVLQTIISLAKNLNMRVVAEGIETAGQMALLKNLGCDYGQGYLISKPKDKEFTEQALYERKLWVEDNDIDSYETLRNITNGKDLPIF